MVFIPKVGDVVKIQNWYGVVLDITYTADNKPAVLQVQTPRNVFRNMGPEFIDIRLAPDKIEPATRADLEQEITFRRKLLEASISDMIAPIDKVEEITEREYLDLLRLMEGLEQPTRNDMDLYDMGGHRDLYNYLTRQMGLFVEAGRGPVWYRAQSLIESYQREQQPVVA